MICLNSSSSIVARHRTRCTGGPALALAAGLLFPERTPPAVVRADPPRVRSAIAPLHRGPTRPAAGVRTQGRRGGCQTGRSRVTPRPTRVGDVVGQPPVVGLADELEYPARAETETLLSSASSFTSGQILLTADSPATGTPRSAGGTYPARGGGSSRAGRGALRTRFGSDWALSLVDLGAVEPILQCHRMGPEVVRDLLDRHTRFAVPGDADDVVTELGG